MGLMLHRNLKNTFDISKSLRHLNLKCIQIFITFRSDIGLISLNANVIVITFSTGSGIDTTDKTGIYIQYEAHTDGAAQASNPLSTINYINTDITFLKYPPKPAETYAVEELSLFLFAQSDRPQDPTERVGVTVVVDRLEGCSDPLRVFKFNGTDWVFERQ